MKIKEKASISWKTKKKIKKKFRKTKIKKKAYVRRNKKIKEKMVVRTEKLPSKGKSKKRQQLGGS